MPRNVWNDTVSWRIQDDSTTLPKYQLLALMNITFKEEELKSVGELSKVCSQNCSEMHDSLTQYWKT